MGWGLPTSGGFGWLCEGNCVFALSYSPYFVHTQPTIGEMGEHGEGLGKIQDHFVQDPPSIGGVVIKFGEGCD